MKTFLLICFLALPLCAHATEKKYFARCSGGANCNACKNCRYCGHCNSGGSCSVCEPSKYSGKKKSKKVAVKEYNDFFKGAK